MKCGNCSETIKTVIMDKIKGTYLVKGKKKIPLCSECQKQDLEKIRKKLKI